MNFSADEVLQALRIYRFVEETPLAYAPKLSHFCNNNIFLKREDLHPIFSFKIRGACNKILALSKSQQAKGVIAASAGNHAQGVAYIANKLGIGATIVMPVSTPVIKIESVERQGANVVVVGDNFDASYQHACALSKSSGQVLISPFDDLDVIAGQGTIGLEIAKQIDVLDYVFLPIGGGGLAAGVSVFLKKFFPKIRMIGVEPRESPTLYSSLKADKRIKLESVGVFAEGVAVEQLGKLNYPILCKNIDDVILVEEDEICCAIKDVFEQTRVVCEPSGAIATAGMKRYLSENGIQNKAVISVVTGANINFDRLVYIASQANIKEGGEGVLAVTIPEKKGSFLRFVESVQQQSITEFNYRFNGSNEAHIFVVLKFKHYKNEIKPLLNHLLQEGYQAANLTDDLVCRSHLKHMIGGKIYQKISERLYLFYFPERIGALLEFLLQLGFIWNITLFHYKNQGSSHGEALIGFEIREGATQQSLEQDLLKTGLRFKAVEDNKAYKMFLS